MKHFHILLVAGFFILGACASPTEVKQTAAPETSEKVSEVTVETPAPTTVPTPSSPPETPLGILSLEENEVLHGQDENALVPLLESASFFEKDLIQVIGGGEAVLDFGDQMRLRLFNDTELEMVAAEIGEDVPLGVQIFLFVGGFTGQLTQEGGRAIFRTPGDVEITVLGTEYFMVYDPPTKETTAGNFSGTVEVASAGSQISLEDGTYVIVPDGGPPGPPLPLPMSREEFENQARETDSPIHAASQAKVWTVEIRHEFNVEVEGSTSTHLRLWTGQFVLDADILEGSGTGVIDNVNVTCPNAEQTKFDIQGSFDFDISGQLVTGEDDRPAFRLEITANNVEMNKSVDSAPCNGFLAAVQDLNRDIVEDLPLLEADAIVVGAAKGAGGIFELDGVPYNNENSIYFQSPIEVTIQPDQ